MLTHTLIFMDTELSIQTKSARCSVPEASYPRVTEINQTYIYYQEIAI